MGNALFKLIHAPDPMFRVLRDLYSSVLSMPELLIERLALLANSFAVMLSSDPSSLKAYTLYKLLSF